MNLHIHKRLFLAAAVLGAVAVFLIGFFVALGVRSAVAGPDAGPLGGHSARPAPPSTAAPARPALITRPWAGGTATQPAATTRPSAEGGATQPAASGPPWAGAG